MLQITSNLIHLKVKLTSYYYQASHLVRSLFVLSLYPLFLNLLSLLISNMFCRLYTVFDKRLCELLLQ